MVLLTEMRRVEMNGRVVPYVWPRRWNVINWLWERVCSYLLLISATGEITCVFRSARLHKRLHRHFYSRGQTYGRMRTIILTIRTKTPEPPCAIPSSMRAVRHGPVWPRNSGTVHFIERPFALKPHIRICKDSHVEFPNQAELRSKIDLKIFS